MRNYVGKSANCENIYNRKIAFYLFIAFVLYALASTLDFYSQVQ